MNRIQLGLEEISTKLLPIGFEGEQNHTQIVFYATTLIGKYPNAVATMTIKAPTGEMYPGVITQDSNIITWDISAANCAADGEGQYQLTFTDGDEIIKTYIGQYRVLSSLIGSGDPPSPIEDWLTEANAALAALEAWEDVEVSGATPSITGEENKRYVCGTVTSISITPPETGMIDVVFVSGSTAATLTATGVTFPEWFDGTLEANTRYEINILDGFGVITAWQST